MTSWSLPASPPVGGSPILCFAARPASPGRILGRVKDWLGHHERLVDLSVLFIFGALFAIKGLTGL